MIKTKKQGLLIVLSGPSGCGKNTVCNALKKENKNLYYEIEQTNKYKNEYTQLIEELKETKNKYEKTYRNLERLEAEFEREKNRLKDKHKYH